MTQEGASGPASPVDEAEVEQQFDLIVKGAAEVIAPEELKARIRKSLATGRPLVAKLGADPSAPDIHLGHAVVLTKLAQIQSLGHQVVFLIGDFTGRIGDPTGRSETRKPLTTDDIAANARTYQDQIYKILDPARTRVAFNSEWLAKMDFADVLRLSSQYTVARLLERDDFAKRFKANHPIGVHELMYPLMQGYDSVALQCDIELGGTDQKFNLLVGRELQRCSGQPPQITITMPILAGLDGVQKMSKSLNNYIGIAEPPQSMFGKAMSISDDQMYTWYLLLTDTSSGQVDALRRSVADGAAHPMDQKTHLAQEIVRRFHGADAARAAVDEFDRVVRKKDLPTDIPALPIEGLFEGETVWIVRIIQAAWSVGSGEAIRQIKQGGVKIDQQKVADKDLKLTREQLKPGTVVQYGKHKFVRLV